MPAGFVAEYRPQTYLCEGEAADYHLVIAFERVVRRMDIQLDVVVPGWDHRTCLDPMHCCKAIECWNRMVNDLCSLALQLADLMGHSSPLAAVGYREIHSDEEDLCKESGLVVVLKAGGVGRVGIDDWNS